MFGKKTPTNPNPVNPTNPNPAATNPNPTTPKPPFDFNASFIKAVNCAIGAEITKMESSKIEKIVERLEEPINDIGFDWNSTVADCSKMFTKHVIKRYNDAAKAERCTQIEALIKAEYESGTPDGDKLNKLEAEFVSLMHERGIHASDTAYILQRTIEKYDDTEDAVHEDYLAFCTILYRLIEEMPESDDKLMKAILIYNLFVISAKALENGYEDFVERAIVVAFDSTNPDVTFEGRFEFIDDANKATAATYKASLVNMATSARMVNILFNNGIEQGSLVLKQLPIKGPAKDPAIMQFAIEKPDGGYVVIEVNGNDASGNFSAQIVKKSA